MADDDDGRSFVPKLVICLIAAASAAVVVTVYHCITTGHILTILRHHQRHRRRNLPTPPHRTFIPGQGQTQHTSIEHSLAELIPSHQYQKGAGLIAEHDGMCAVCLCDFEDGEELRTLPECMHSYHAPCIDMWLYSHSNCPMCRTNAAPSPQMLMHLLERPPSSPLPLQQMPANLRNLPNSSL